LLGQGAPPIFPAIINLIGVFKGSYQKHMKAACLKHNPTFIFRKHPLEKTQMSIKGFAL
jgi:hypothetical protein